MKKRQWFCILLSVLTQISCHSQINNKWDLEKLQQAEDYSNQIGTFSFILMTDGKVIKAWGDTTTPTSIHSARKALSSTVYANYIGKGKGELDLDKNLAELGIDDYPDPLTELQKQAKILYLIKSTSGINHSAAGETEGMRNDKNFMLGSAPNVPGTKWSYNNWDYNALTAIFEKETGISEKEAFLKNIAYPLQMKDITDRTINYNQDTSLSIYSSIGYNLSARDMAKFGQLCLNNGNWDGKQLVPKEYFAKITSEYIKTGFQGLQSGHSYLWWVPCDDIAKEIGIPAGTYTASGAGNQHILIIPKWNTVIVHKTNTNLREGFFLWLNQKGYADSTYVLNNLTTIQDEYVDFVGNKCRLPENLDNEICKKCRTVNDADFRKLLTMIFESKIK
jgi:CubicO group peptidase (beta-lactamase class C family)